MRGQLFGVLAVSSGLKEQLAPVLRYITRRALIRGPAANSPRFVDLLG